LCEGVPDRRSTIVVLETFVVSEHGSEATVSLVAHKDTREARGKLVRNRSTGQKATRARWTLNRERIAAIPSRRGQRLNQQEVHRKPDGSTPVRVTAEDAAVRHPGPVRHFVALPDFK
jgi:hypothetical protein